VGIGRLSSQPGAGILAGLRVLEVSAFVAAPLGGATLAAMGADVVRVDPIGGGIDARRWPLHRGRSLYWAGLNQGKRSVTVDTRSEPGRELVAGLARELGTVLTNLPVAGWMTWEALASGRPDLVLVAITGNPDGTSAVDYTVNAATGWPFVTGPAGEEGPVNHVLPAWDVATGFLAAASLLAADRHRLRTGQGQAVTISLADVALAVTAHLGAVAEAVLEAKPRPRTGNDTYGTLGRDFRTRDGRYVMALALTPRQWRSLCAAVGMEFPSEFIREEVRFERRAEVWAVLEPWVAERTLAEVALVFDQHQVLWGPYRTFQQLVEEDPRVRRNPMFAEVEQPGIGRWPVTASPVEFGAVPRLPSRRGPAMGEHTDEVLTEVLGLRSAELQRLRAEGVIG
jgi:2-methylfumaryl-CoA isomerase